MLRDEIACGRRGPVRGGEGLDEVTGPPFDRIGLGGRGVLGEAERRPQARDGPDLAGEDLRGPQDREHEVDQLLALRRLAEDVEAVADLDVLDLAEPAVDVHDEVVEAVGVVEVDVVAQPEVDVHLRGVQQLPDLATQGRRLGRVHDRDVAVLVEELLGREMSP